MATSLYSLAHNSLQQSIAWYSSKKRHWNYPPNLELQNAVRDDLRILKTAAEKLEEKVIKISAFGLVSRGKSSVINALLGQKILTTGPINGVTKWPKSIRWTPPTGKIQIELIDTPGLDEIDGEIRANMAKEISQQSDLILFVIAGDITRTEYLALLELRQWQKPLILVFNKIDLYPETDLNSIYQQLQQLSNQTKKPLFSPDEIVLVSAEPQPINLRIELPNGKIKEELEYLSPNIESLQQKILTILNREGKALLALNSLNQARIAQKNIARKTIQIRSKEAEDIIWRYAKYKALIVAVNPFIFLDLIGGLITDLTMIRALARLYGLPITSYEAGNLWQTIVKSCGGLLLTEIGTMIVLGWAKTSYAINSLWENPASFTTLATTALAQGTMAGYGSYLVGKTAQIYLENGCTWGNSGVDTIISEIIAQMPPDSIVSRLI
ncbi:GTP-binding protein [Geminocystis sp. NIES-3709]|uniref:GTP-binding protein n=1 Tax=Geminocystis sp. NIES-3709 TaxID=1617448 RepID=UPI0005FCBBA7|nr:GTP-binding protein [Geminocystis sp. NIES-3709]BAQ64248.1 small GTP-binding protein domain [Geminocystis sp. NIES-3709]